MQKEDSSQREKEIGFTPIFYYGMKVETFSYKSEDELAANTYIVINNKKEAVVIDPSVNYDGVINYLDNNSIKLKVVLLTHGHFDHIRGVDRLVDKYNVPVYCHFYDENLLIDSYKNCSVDYGEKVVVKAKPITCNDDEILKLVDDEIKVIHTPYHTRGSCCYLFINSNLLFSGDSLFKMTVGRDDLPTSVPQEKNNSIKKIMKLDDSIKVYPGHGNSTTIGFERAFNRFLYR